MGVFGVKLGGNNGTTPNGLTGLMTLGCFFVCFFWFFFLGGALLYVLCELLFCFSFFFFFYDQTLYLLLAGAVWDRWEQDLAFKKTGEQVDSVFTFFSKYKMGH